MQKSLLVGLIVIVLIPQITFAAWWNPFTWVSNSTNTISINASSSTTTVITKTVEVPIYKDRIVTQTVKVNDPELQAKYNLLVRNDNETLKAYDNLLSSFNKLKEENKTLLYELNKTVDMYGQCVGIVKSLSATPVNLPHPTTCSYSSYAGGGMLNCY